MTDEPTAAEEESPPTGSPEAGEPQAEADEPQAEAEVDESASEVSESDEPAADEPAADEPSADEPAADEPAADEPAADEPAADEPSADEPAADEPAAESEEPAADDAADAAAEAVAEAEATAAAAAEAVAKAEAAAMAAATALAKSESATKAAPSEAKSEGAQDSAPPADTPSGEAPPRDAAWLGGQVYAFLSSYGFAVVLILFLFLLTFLGTIEQVHKGLYEVQKKYFESLFLVHRLQVGPLDLPIPLPGVYLLLILLAINLTLGGLVRIKKHKRTVGVIVIHIGMMLLLLAGLVKLKWSDDGHLTLKEGQQAAHYTSYHLWEVAIWDADSKGETEEILIPDAEITRLTEGRTTTFKHAKLPFELKLSGYVQNARPMPAGPMWTPSSPVVDGYGLKSEKVASSNELNIAGLYGEALVDGKPHPGLMWGWRNAGAWVVNAGGKRWAIDLRRKRYSMPFMVRLDKFTRELHPRTSIPRVYQSEVTKIEEGTVSQVKIAMNEPLRHSGFVLFQSSFGEDSDKRLYSTFSVVRNPSDYWPLYACIVISIGLLIAFGQKLAGYVRSQAPKRSSS